jgi:hypothetical protein
VAPKVGVKLIPEPVVWCGAWRPFQYDDQLHPTGSALRYAQRRAPSVSVHAASALKRIQRVERNGGRLVLLNRNELGG